jgi:hypothetical protein
VRLCVASSLALSLANCAVSVCLSALLCPSHRIAAQLCCACFNGASLTLWFSRSCRYYRAHNASLTPVFPLPLCASRAECYDAKYNAYLPLAIIILLLYVLVGPALIVLLLNRNRLRIRGEDAQFIAAYGSLFDVYRPGVFFFEVSAHSACYQCYDSSWPLDLIG